MFSGFDDGGWWLVVLGCRGSQRQPKAGRELAEKHQDQWGEGGWRVKERKEREGGFEFWSNFFDLSNNLAEFLS